MKAPPLATSGASSIIAIATLLLMMPAPAQAEGQDTAAYVSRSLRCDGFDNNRCFRFADPRRRGKPYLQPRTHHHHHHDAHDTRYVVERRPLAPPNVHEHAWRDRDHSGREHSWREGGRYRMIGTGTTATGTMIVATATGAMSATSANACIRSPPRAPRRKRKTERSFRPNGHGAPGCAPIMASATRISTPPRMANIAAGVRRPTKARSARSVNS